MSMAGEKHRAENPSPRGMLVKTMSPAAAKQMRGEIVHVLHEPLPEGRARVLRAAAPGRLAQLTIANGGQIVSARALEAVSAGDEVFVNSRDGTCVKIGTAIKPVPSNLIEEIDVNDKHNRTMYSLHQSGNGDHTPIFMLGDDHLGRIIAYYTKRFLENREKFSSAPNQQDPMLAAMGKKEAWTPDRLVGETTQVLVTLQPYICEATLRGNAVLDVATNCLRSIAKRSDGIDPGPKQIGVDEVPQLEETLP